MNQERRRSDIVLDAVVRLAWFAPGLYMLWVAVAAVLDLPPPYLGISGYDFPLWATPADKTWVVPAVLVGGVCWCVMVLRLPGWRERLGDRGPGRSAASRR